MASRDDRIYAAGLFDGEGSVHMRLVQQRGRRYAHSVLIVTVTNTYLPILAWLHARWAGHVSIRHRTGRPCGDWILSARAGARFLADIVEFSRIKRAQVENALAFQQRKARKRYRLTAEDREIDLRFIQHDRHLKAVGR